MRLLSAALAATLASGCASLPTGALLHRHEAIAASSGVQARIAADAVLTLPAPPNYPGVRTIVQSGRAHYGDRDGAFDAVLSLSPERVEIVLAMAAGPRLATIDWDAHGVREERAVFAPDNVPVANILADIFVSTWPADAVAEALPEGLKLRVSEDGGRVISRGAETIVDITPDPAQPGRIVVRNAALGYQVTLITQSQD